jgi:PIN domain nuclease of toxin-antitoxin system
VRLLLDTHIWLWALLEPARLSRRVAAHLQDPANELWLSAISVWEAIVLAERGRIELDDEPARWIDRELKRTPVRDASVTREIASASRVLPLPHEDPADRFIAATAHVLDLVLVTADRRLQRSKSYEVMAVSSAG